jgi:oleate hydratase
MSSSRDAQKTQAWLIGGGIASLAAAVHLIKRAEVPANHIHILDVHDSSGGAMHISGDSAKGYVINAGAQPYLHEDCVEELRSMLPNLQGPIKLPKRLAGENMQRSETHQGNFLAVKLMREQQTESCIHWLHVGIKHRLSLVKLIMENEETIGSKSICDIFQDSLFQTEFWLLWSTA